MLRSIGPADVRFRNGMTLLREVSTLQYCASCKQYEPQLFVVRKADKQVFKQCQTCGRLVYVGEPEEGGEPYEKVFTPSPA